MWPGVPVYLCTWHVKRAWLKHLVRHVKDKAARLQMFDELGRILHSAATEPGADADAEVVAALDKFYKTFKRYKGFIAYFKKTWKEDVKVGGWVGGAWGELEGEGGIWWWHHMRQPPVPMPALVLRVSHPHTLSHCQVPGQRYPPDVHHCCCRPEAPPVNLALLPLPRCGRTASGAGSQLPARRAQTPLRATMERSRAAPRGCARGASGTGAWTGCSGA